VPFDEVDPVGVDDTVVSATDSEVVCDQNDRPFGWGCYPGLFRASESSSSLSTAVSISASTMVASVVPPLVMSVVSGLHFYLVNSCLNYV
jgi:hypothetical protein